MTRATLLAFAILAACGAPAAPAAKTPAVDVIASIESPAPSPAAALAQSADAPCFDGPALVATTMLFDLVEYGTSQDFWDENTPLPTTDYGSCRVADGAIYTADGDKAADLHCGISVHASGCSGTRAIRRSSSARWQPVGTSVVSRRRPPTWPTYSMPPVMNLS